MKFKPVKGSSLTEAQAADFGGEIEKLADEKGRVTAEDVIAAAQPGTALHNFFEWDNENAADKYRLIQAGYLLRSINVVIETPDGEQETRAWQVVTVKTESQPDRGYMAAVKVFSDADYSAEVVARALKELTAWKQRYRQYAQLSEIVKALDALIK